MEARRRSINFGFPGYDGSLPRAVRSLRGRGEGLRKSKDASKGMGFFDLLVTVAGQILQDGDECEEKKVNFSADHEMAKNKTVDTKEKVSADEQSEMLSEDQIGALLNELHRGGSMLASKVENGRTGQESNLDRREFVNDGKFEHDVIDSCQVEAVKALLSPYEKHSQEPFTISNQEDGDASILHMDACGASSVKCMGLQTSSVKGQESLSITHEDQLLPACGAYLEDVSSRKVEVGQRQRLEGFENCGEDVVVSDLNPLTAEVAPGKLACSFIDFREGKGESENDYGSFRRWITTEEGVRLIEHDGLTFDDEKPPLVSSGSSGEAPMCMEGNSSEIYFNISSERQAGRRRKVSRESNARDNDDNSSESAVPKTVPKKPIKKMSYLKALKSRRLENDTTRNRFPGPGSKRKHAELEGKVASFASCPTSPIANPSSKMSGKKSAEPHVKLSIKSFTVPELSVDLPESATVANLKRAVMEAAMNLLGGGLRVRVLLQGKKVPDESASLVQVGISRTGKLDSLGFMLEPSPIPTSPTGTEDQILVLSCAANQSASRYSAFSIGGEVNQNTFKGHNGKVNGAMEANAANNTALGVQADAVNQLKSDLDPPSSASHGPLVPGSGALILHPSLGGEGVQGLALVPVSQKLRNTEIGKRRMRRPFSVAEVEALVHAVEKLGTGRWRDVKLQAFDQAKHRTYVDLKDKWKTLVHTAQIAPHQRRGEPVPQELLDRVTQAHSYWTAQQAKQQADLGL